ncbi:MAG: class I SAM-dependent rRNA methyltransferase [Chloroflexota bacterium]
MDVVRLKPQRERSVRLHHPWIFSGAVAKVEGDPQLGDTVEVLGHGGEWLARGAYSPVSQIRVRLWTWHEDEVIDASWIATRLERAIHCRDPLFDRAVTTAWREVHAESDGLPGLIVDRYQDFRVVQFLSAGAERWRSAVVEALAARGGCRGLYERSDVEARELEGLPRRSGLLWGEPPPTDLTIRQHGLRYRVDVAQGHKTGFYLDQRDNRDCLRAFAVGKAALNVFCYTGGFTLEALAGGAASVASVESSAAALALAQENVRLNGLPLERCQWLEGDAFQELRRLRDKGQSFDLIVLDPPRFAPTEAQSQRAARGYKDINLLAFKLLRPGGILFTFSCSGGVSPDLFQKIVAGAALDAGVEASIIGWLGQPPDHPVALHFPEGRYLKGLICRV